MTSQDYFDILWEKGRRNYYNLARPESQKLIDLMFYELSEQKDESIEELIEHKKKYIEFEIDKLFEKRINQECWDRNIFRADNEEYADFSERRYKAIGCY